MIKILHLISCDTIIGEVDEDSSEYTITHPFIMDTVDDPDQGSGVRMDYLLTFSKDNCVHIKKSDVVYTYNPSERMEEYYTRLSEYTVTKDHDKVLKETIESMDEMDRRYKQLVSRKFVGKNTVN